MMPRKKLVYYANKHGVAYSNMKLTDDEPKQICSGVGSKYYSSKDCGGSVSTLIDCVMDDGEFRNRHRKDGVAEDLFEMRCADYAADEVMAAVAKIRKG